MLRLLSSAVLCALFVIHVEFVPVDSDIRLYHVNNKLLWLCICLTLVPGGWKGVESVD